MSESTTEKREQWLMKHIGEYIMARAEIHQAADKDPELLKHLVWSPKIGDRCWHMRNYLKQKGFDDPRWAMESFLAIEHYIKSCPIVPDYVSDAIEIEWLDTIIAVEPAVQQRITEITTLKENETR